MTTRPPTTRERFVERWKARRDALALERAIAHAQTPALRQELQTLHRRS